MVKCKKCGVLIDSPGKICPLCKSTIEQEIDNSYPVITKKIKKSFVRKLVLFIVLVISLISILINYELTPKYRWSGFVVLGLASTYLVFRSIMDGRKSVLKLLFTLNFLIIILAIVWDYYTGYRGWSVNFVFPSMCISYGLFLIILRIVSYFAFKESSDYIYLNVLLELTPLLLLHFGIISFKPLALVSGIFGIINLFILIFFDWARLKSDLIKKLHI